ncbi:KdsC family phosphatase [Massilia antarctica]|uniref:KdsC family phosphatase n=1 Tax=Massilia antarctica TaxID=2765360 RepID=UPI0006BB69F0|nr:HAD family hydrolase [Massilia sp. H27-R4]MCY0914962.1 HAD family hydrolase [Massilia sp. H27-R4]CUI06928.1 3-deoxy-D-manno-octulosonate 8-phosphate phosphatase [Janthinobacterium sp. CG23_2]CUU30714.1 3-deoxy-D-manno-octulosonate 8-phosphate phosphatase [Janthinobacterium sp. CG23_2]
MTQPDVSSPYQLDHLRRAAAVKVMIFDVDGVLTDGSLTYGPDGEATKTFNVLDGLGIQLLQKSGVATAIISARQSPIVVRRAADLGIMHVHQGIHDKRIAFAKLLEATGVTAAQCGYIGDDVIDLPLLLQVGFAATVPTGHPEVQYRAHYVTKAGGGRGAVREVCDMVMRAQGSYEAALAPYFA